VNVFLAVYAGFVGRANAEFGTGMGRHLTIRLGWIVLEKRGKDNFTTFPHEHNVHVLRRKFKENLSLN